MPEKEKKPAFPNRLIEKLVSIVQGGKVESNCESQLVVIPTALQALSCDWHNHQKAEQRRKENNKERKASKGETFQFIEIRFQDQTADGFA